MSRPHRFGGFFILLWNQERVQHTGFYLGIGVKSTKVLEKRTSCLFWFLSQDTKKPDIHSNW